MTEIYGTWANEKVCPICGKDFIVTSESWAYKIRAGSSFRYFCSYHCFREQERRNEEKRKNRKKLDRDTMCGKGDDIKSMLLEGVRPVEICRKLSVAHGTISYYKSKLRAEGYAI